MEKISKIVDAKDGGIETPNIAFMKWYTNWLKKTIDNVYVFISIPNEILVPAVRFG